VPDMSAAISADTPRPLPAAQEALEHYKTKDTSKGAPPSLFPFLNRFSVSVVSSLHTFP